MKAKIRLAVALMSAMIVASALPVFSAPNADSNWTGVYLEDFARETLDAPGNGVPLSDSATLLYWNTHYNGTFTIVNQVLVAQCNNGGCYRFATSNGKRWKYCIVRMKGDARAKNADVYFRIASQGPADSGGISDANKGGVSERGLDTLVGPDSLPMPKITTQFKLFVVDLAKNGLHFGDVGGANAFQFGSHAAMELDVDYIFTTNINPFSSAVKKVSQAAKPVSQAKVWISKTASAITVTTGSAGMSGKLSLFDLRGKTIQSFAVQSKGNTCQIPVAAGSLSENTYLYSLTGTSGAVLAKGKISIR
jgi:hypothetical protein